MEFDTPDRTVFEYRPREVTGNRNAIHQSATNQPTAYCLHPFQPAGRDLCGLTFGPRVVADNGNVGYPGLIEQRRTLLEQVLANARSNPSSRLRRHRSILGPRRGWSQPACLRYGRLNVMKRGLPVENNTWVLIGTNHQGGPTPPCCTSDSISAGKDWMSVCSTSAVSVTTAPPDADSLRELVRRAATYGGPVHAVIESMTGARFVHDTLEMHGWEVDIADAQKVKAGPVPPPPGAPPGDVEEPRPCQPHELRQALLGLGSLRGLRTRDAGPARPPRTLDREHHDRAAPDRRPRRHRRGGQRHRAPTTGSRSRPSLRLAAPVCAGCGLPTSAARRRFHISSPTISDIS